MFDPGRQDHMNCKWEQKEMNLKWKAKKKKNLQSAPNPFYDF